MAAIDLLRNRRLTDAHTGGQTSTVGEPSLFMCGDNALFTGNWFASFSRNGGADWSPLNPYTFFPEPEGEFCCDQTVLYDPSRDLVFWILQYEPDSRGNTLRVAVNDGPDFAEDGWRWHDFRPDAVNPAWQREWFDYNHAALGNNHLFVATNTFRISNDAFTRSVVLRLPLDDLAGTGPVDYRYYQSTEDFSLRCTAGARGVMYLASLPSQEHVRVFDWAENSTSIGVRDVPVSRWNIGQYSAPCPDGENWLSRADDRITGAWTANGRIGVLWTANRAPPQRPFPYVRAVVLDAATFEVIAEPDIWSRRWAYAHPDACPNADGHIGLTLFRGGGELFPSHVVGLWDDPAGQWRLRGTRNGSHSPNDGKWGDYVSIRPGAPNARTWVAAGFTLQGGGGRTSIEPRMVEFGIQS